MTQKPINENIVNTNKCRLDTDKFIYLLMQKPQLQEALQIFFHCYSLTNINDIEKEKAAAQQRYRNHLLDKAILATGIFPIHTHPTLLNTPPPLYNSINNITIQTHFDPPSLFFPSRFSKTFKKTPK